LQAHRGGSFFSRKGKSTLPLKPALSFEKQVELLRSRGMAIEDEQEAIEFFQNNQYYRLNIYFHRFMIDNKCNKFIEGTSFSQIKDVYYNDSWLRILIMSLLEPIEIKMRSQISNRVGLTYGPGAFYCRDIYKEPAIYREVFQKFKSEIERNSSDPVIRHHNRFYGGMFPIWVVVEYLSFQCAFQVLLKST
jgi:abortive infection bacteriophage resistance protein